MAKAGDSALLFQLVWTLGALGMVAVAAVATFGWLRGLGILAAVWLLMPPSGSR